MTTEERIEFLEGQTIVLKLALAALVIMHPRKEEITGLLKKISSYPEVVSSTQPYKAGIYSVLQEVDDLSKTALLADAARAQAPGKKNH